MNNQLSVLPDSIKNLRNHLVLINIQNNPIFLYTSTDSNMLGKVEANDIFGDKVVVDISLFNGEDIDETVFLSQYKTRDLHWNLDKLKELRLEEVEKTSLSRNDMIKIVKKAAKFDGKDRLIGNLEKYLLIGYINLLHGYAAVAYYSGGYVMDGKKTSIIINLLGYILNHLNQAIENNEVGSLKYGLNAIAQSIKYCPDRKISALKDAYAMIRCDYEYEKNELLKFIKNRIIALKEHKFKMIMTPADYENVHDLNYWMYQFKDILGFRMEFQSILTRIFLFPFSFYRGDVLKTFLDFFTPKYVINVLTDEINKNNEMMCELMNMIDKDEKLTPEEKVQLGVDALDYDKCEGIDSKAVEYILLKMKLINKRNPGEDSNINVDRFTLETTDIISKFKETVYGIFNI